MKRELQKKKKRRRTWSALLNSFWCMDLRPEQFQKSHKRYYEATEILFLQRMLQISRTVKKPNERVLPKSETTSLRKRKHKYLATFFCHVLKRDQLEHLVTSGMIEGNQQEKMLNEFKKIHNMERVIDALREMRDRDA